MSYPRLPTFRGFFDGPGLSDILLSILPFVAPVLWRKRQRIANFLKDKIALFEFEIISGLLVTITLVTGIVFVIESYVLSTFLTYMFAMLALATAVMGTYLRYRL